MKIKYLIELIVILLIIYAIIVNPKKDEPKDISAYLITSAFGLTALDHLAILNFLNPDANISMELNLFDYSIILIALISGIILSLKEKNSYQVFNLLGENIKKELINDNYKIKNIGVGIVRERSIDFMKLLETQEMSEEVDGAVRTMIKHEAEIINNFSTNGDIYIASMASIPYTVLFGMHLMDNNSIKYVNYNRLESEYKLLPNKKRKSELLPLDISKTLSSSNELLVVISITAKITEEDISDFNIDNKVSISTQCIKENVIESQEEIKTIANEIVSILVDLSKANNGIHIVAAIPGMLSVELGKVIRNRNNQLSQINIYHYNAQSKPRYKYGIVINSKDESKKIIERG